MTIYGYHVQLYKLYKAYGFTSWASKEAPMKQTQLQYLYDKSFIKRVVREYAEKQREDIKSFPGGNWQFWVFTNKGKEMISKLESDPDVVVDLAKKLLMGV